MISPPAHLIASLKARYDEPERHYHTWKHVEALLSHFAAFQHLVSEPRPVLWAIYWHDAIYDARASDNEEQSADLLAKDAQQHLNAQELQLAYDIILGTKRHEIIDGYVGSQASDMAIMLDIDLSILAAPENIFDEYEANVRAEYAFVPETTFRAGRSSILAKFLDRERIYFSDACAEKWEASARYNLKRSLAALAVS